jgi:hypothetical protein
MPTAVFLYSSVVFHEYLVLNDVYRYENIYEKMFRQI